MEPGTFVGMPSTMIEGETLDSLDASRGLPRVQSGRTGTNLNSDVLPIAAANCFADRQVTRGGIA